MLQISAVAVCYFAILSCVPGTLGAMTPEEALAALRDANERLSVLQQQLEYLDIEEETAEELLHEQASETEEDKQSDGAPKEHAEEEPAVVQVRKDAGFASEVARLNRITFNDNVAREGNDHVVHWFIRFCYDWYAPCGMMGPMFEELASEFQEELNKGDVVKTTVRFAEVDCGVDKPLCNEQGAEYYPSVVHYHKHKPVKTWRGRTELDWNKRSLAKWLTKTSEEIREAARIEAAKPLIPPTSLDPVHAAVGVLSFCGVMAAHLWLLAAPKPLKVQASANAVSNTGVSNQPAVVRSMLPEHWVLPVSASSVIDL